MNSMRSLRLLAPMLCCWLTACALTRGEPAEPEPGFVTVEIVGVAMDPEAQSPLVLLRDPQTQHVVPIWIGVPEAEAIARALHGVAVARPMTHDLLASTIEELGARVEEVVILGEREGTYYGAIRLATGARGRRIEIDSRPSDGLALALRANAPIRVARDLLVDPTDATRPRPPRRAA